MLWYRMRTLCYAALQRSNKQRMNLRYSIEQYDKHGFLHAPVLLWLGWLFLAKAWLVLILAGVSRQSGSDILAFAYPDHSMLYLALLTGTPSLAMMWLISWRSPQRHWVNRIVSWGKWVTLGLIGLQFAQTVYHVYLQHGVFRWSNALTLLVLMWLALYIARSRRIQDCLCIPPAANR